MAEYIEREAAIQAASIWNGDESTEAWIQSALQKLPAADVAPVRHGRWIDGKVRHIKNGELRNMRECSECGSCYFVYDAYNSVEEVPNYCPNCGARMDGGEGNG